MSLGDCVLVRDCAPLFGRSELVVLYALASRMGRLGESFPSLEQLGIDTSMSGRNAARVVTKLEALGVLKISRSRENGRSSNRYRLNHDLLDGVRRRLRADDVNSGQRRGAAKAAAIRGRAQGLRTELEARTRRRDVRRVIGATAMTLRMSSTNRTKPRRLKDDTAVSEERKGNETESETAAKPSHDLSNHPMQILTPLAEACGVSPYELSKAASTSDEARAIMADWRDGLIGKAEVDLMIARGASIASAHR